MNNFIIQAQCVTLTELQHLFIDMEYEKPQNKSFGVYRSRSFNQKNKKYLQTEEIKTALKEIERTKLKYIYLTGKNAMSHPEFNQILRLCLSFCSVTIFSDGSCINDKKARFLKRVEDEGTNEIIFKIKLNHYDEKTNDNIAGRGSFRKALHSITSLNKYGFNPILLIQAKSEDIEDLKEGFIELGTKFGFETDDINFSFIPATKTNAQENNLNSEEKPVTNVINIKTDCMTSRLLTKSGVYTCPLLINDYRGRCGSSLADYSKKCYLEAEECLLCKKFGQNLYSNNWI